MPDVTIIFTHFGYSSYLEYTLACARKTNPDARLILLGDQFNVGAALKHGWEHFSFNNYTSRFHDRFNKVFRHIQGREHNPIKNNQDWLRYVFERWYFIEGFLTQESIQRFWHFDSDTMILQDLKIHQDNLSKVDFTVQCNNTCLNGVISPIVVSEFCAHICDLFENFEFIKNQQHEFDTLNPGYAFTEMRAFDQYKNSTSRPWVHLLNYKDNQVFDDCISQRHGFKMCSLPSGEIVKELQSRNGKFYGIREGVEIELITLNLSWVRDYFFAWVLEALNADMHILNIRAPNHLKAIGLAKKIRRLINNEII